MQSELNPENDHVYQPEGLYKKSSFYFGISFAAHMTLVLFLLFMPESQSGGIDFTRFESIDVQLVSLSTIPPSSSSGQGGGGGGVSTSDTVEDFHQDRVAPAEPTTIPMKSRTPRAVDPSSHTLTLPEKLRPAEPSIKRSTAPRPSESVRKEVVKPDELKRQEGERQVADTVRRMQEEVETRESRRQASIRERIGQMEGEVGQDTRPRGTGSVSGSGGQDGRSGGGARGNYTRLQIYQAEVRQALRRNWVFSEALAGDTRGLESRVVLKIMPNGEITDVWFEKRSGNEYLDESAYKTVMKSDPLPPLPDGLPHYQLLVGFTPGGLQ